MYRRRANAWLLGSSDFPEDWEHGMDWLDGLLGGIDAAVADAAARAKLGKPSAWQTRPLRCECCCTRALRGHRVSAKRASTEGQSVDDEAGFSRRPIVHASSIAIAAPCAR